MWFVPPEIQSLPQLCLLTSLYGIIIYKGNELISEGSEYLLLVSSISSFVGSVVLPVLGAVPDGLMVFFSGFGQVAQEEVSVGMGALAGSTVLLLTLPWFLTILGGRVNITQGTLQYKKPPGQRLVPPGFFSFTQTGIPIEESVKVNASLMLRTSFLLLVIQIPVILGYSDPDNIRTLSFIGMLACLFSFVSYFLVVLLSGGSHRSIIDDIITERRIDAIRRGEMNLRGVMHFLIRNDDVLKYVRNDSVRYTGDNSLNNTGRFSVSNCLSVCLLPFYNKTKSDCCDEVRNGMKRLLSPFFSQFDLNKNGVIDFDEFKQLMTQLRESLSLEQIEKIFIFADSNCNEKIEFEEFVDLMIAYVRDYEKIFPDKDEQKIIRRRKSSTSTLVSVRPESINFLQDGDSPGAKLKEEDMEEGSVPEGLADLPPQQQQKKAIFEATKLLLLGTVLVVMFTDPFVDAMNEIGTRLAINPFYVSFLLAPIASNASELISSYTYSSMKTRRSLRVSLTTLEGSACMNNTFVLGIFYSLVFFNKLNWDFSAEVFGTFFVQVCVAAMTSTRSIHRPLEGLLILSLYPLSIFVIHTLNKYE